MQNAFVSKGGMFDLAGFDISGAAPAIAANQRLLAASRRAGVKVIYLQMSYQPDLSDAGDASSPNYHKELGMVMMRAAPRTARQAADRRQLGLADRRCADAGAGRPYRAQIALQRLLRHRSGGVSAGARTSSYLLFTGVATNVCVESTARDAFFAEFWPILVEDAMNHSGPDFNRQATLWNFEHVFGWVTSADQVIAALEVKRWQRRYRLIRSRLGYVSTGSGERRRLQAGIT